nr:glycosidase-like protein [Paraburkholderia rhynchosiae]
MVLATLPTISTATGHGTTACGVPMHGFNLVQDKQAQFGSAQALTSMRRMRDTGANTVALIPFLWQPHPDSREIGRGVDMSDAQLADGIRAAHRLGLKVIVKPQVWIPGSWAGAVRMNTDADWNAWFDGYARALNAIAAVAAREHAEGLVVGTELDESAARPEWRALIARIRRVFHGELSYAAHNVDGAQRVTFWPLLDSVGVTLYPVLGADDDPAQWTRVMHETSEHLRALARRTGKPVLIAEIGLRSAAGAAAKPWESAEERVAAPDEALQSRVLEHWLDALDEPAVRTVLMWRWISDPDAGGEKDTDFTVQRKQAERMLSSRWRRCGAAPVSETAP